MGSYGKKSFDAPESRCLVSIELDNECFCTTHLENHIEGSRIKQANEIVKFIKKMNMKHHTLIGDLNAVNEASYTKPELKILKELNFGKKDVPTDVIDIFNKSGLIGKNPVNTGQKYESLFQKCVSHAYSTKYKNSCMIFTDVTDFDHQPIVIW